MCASHLCFPVQSVSVFKVALVFISYLRMFVAVIMFWFSLPTSLVWISVVLAAIL